MPRPRFRITKDEMGSWVVEVDSNPRRWFNTEAEAEAFCDGFNNCYDNFVLSD